MKLRDISGTIKMECLRKKLIPNLKERVRRKITESYTEVRMFVYEYKKGHQPRNSHNGDYEYNLLGCDTMHFGRSLPLFL
jgi:hypothetical protein